MAFSGGLGDRSDDLRFRNPQSPRDESTFSGFTSPRRTLASQMHAPAPPSHDARASLTRRFTTNTVPTLPTLSPLSPIGQQRRQAAEPQEITTATYHKAQLYEKKRLEVEFLREQRRRFAAEMALIEFQAQQDEGELERMSLDLTKFSLTSGGHQSEPTTPPEYRDNNGFPSAFSRLNRFSISSSNITSPPGMMSNRQSRSGSQATSHTTTQSISHIPSKSVPGSRRNSAEDEDTFGDITSVDRRATVAQNRNSMPVTGYDLRQRNADELPGVSSILGHIDTTSFLFTDEDKQAQSKNTVTSPEPKSYLQMNTTDDDFPTLRTIRGDAGAHQLSASSAALDLALSQSPGPEGQGQNQGQASNGWSAFARHRQAQHSLPMNVLRQSNTEFDLTTAGSDKPLTNNRHSMEVKFSPFENTPRGGVLATPPNGSVNNMPKLQSSYSTNDIPTVKNSGGLNGTMTPAAHINSHAEQHRHNHNASLGRIPPNSVNRHSRELSGDARLDEQKSPYRPMQSVLHASAAPFGPGRTSTSYNNNNHNPTSNAASVAPQNLDPFGSPAGLNSNTGGPNGSAYYGGYGMSMSMMNMGMGFNGMNSMNGLNSIPGLNGMNPLGNQPQWPGQMPPPMYPNPYGQFAQAYQQYGPNRFHDSQARVIRERRMQANDENARFQNFDLEVRRSEIYGLCKDQHGCRFLQKKLEERNAKSMQIIFEETNEHVVELMTDPFGNYLCQKLLEFSSADQRTTLINNAAPHMVKIALNQHGTRALQKMIEFVATPDNVLFSSYGKNTSTPKATNKLLQIETIIHALKDQVVQLIQDLNGNHVIQKCLNHLEPSNAQFIFDAVGEHCVEVGTHRHGCCVLQRCIDHASGVQKAQLVHHLTQNAPTLVQDAYGNYVIQYILDTDNPDFIIPLCREFYGKIIPLSKQKFSSNVIEKCIRVGDVEVKQMFVSELLRPAELERLIRDNYGNYVVQTALEHGDDESKVQLFDAIRPLMPSIRHTPYGRRIQSKLNERDGRPSGSSSTHITPRNTPGRAPAQLATGYRNPVPGQASYQSPESNYSPISSAYGSNIASPTPHRLSNPPLPALQAAVQQYGPYGRGGQSNGLNGGNFF